MYKRKPIRLIALLMTLCMLLSVLPGSGLRTEAAEADAKQPESAPSAETQLAATAQTLSKDCKILNYVHAEVFGSANHVARLASEETLSSYVFLNADGTRTAYYLDEAVKFVDADGKVQEKDLMLVPTVGGYTTEKNDIGLSIPTNPASGVTLLWNNTAVRIIPQGGTVGETVVEDNTVRYVDYYGSGMDLVYTPTLSGLKEDIVLQNYAGKNTFTFMLNTGGLNLYSANGRYYLATSKTATARIDLGDVVTFDARGRFSVGTMTAQTVTAGQIYRLTLTVDEDFLTDPNTVYPVSIDPTMTVSDNDTAGDIEDVSIYQGRPTTNGNWTYLHSGYYDSTYGVARTLFRLKGLIESSIYQGLTANQILAAEFHIWEASGTTAANVYLKANTGRSEWTEGGATWDGAGVALGTTYDTRSIGINAKATFNITQLVKDWKTGVQNVQKGFVLQSSNETSLDKAFYSSEHSTTAKRPYAVLNYITTNNTIGLVNTTLTLNEGTTGIISKQSVPSGLGVEWTSSNTAVATVDENGVVTAKKAGVATITASATGADSQTCTVYVTIADGVYRLKNLGSQYYLDACGANISQENLTNIRQRTSISAGNDRLAQMWKIKYLGGGYYSIRPMHKLDMGLNADTSDVNLIEIGTSDLVSGVTTNARWTITFNTNGYVLKRGGLNARTLAPYANVTTANSMIVAATYSASVAAQRWDLQKLTSSPKGVLVYNAVTGLAIANPNSHIVYTGINQSKTIPQLLLEIAVYSGDFVSQGIDLSSGSLSIATVSTNSDQITGSASGTTTITITSSNDRTIYERFGLKVTENAFHIKNYYNSSFSSAKIALLDETIAFADMAYAKLFSVSIRQAGSPSLDTVTGLNSCPVGTTGHCTDNQCGSDTMHCKNLLMICGQLSSSRTTDNLIPILWTHQDGDFYCNTDKGHVLYDTNTYAACYPTIPGILMMRQDGTTDNANISLMSIVLTHELAHLFGIDEDKYYRDTHMPDDWQCVMEAMHSNEQERWTYYQQVLTQEKDAFCSACKEELDYNLPELNLFA